MADTVKRYRESGDLCDEEAAKIRQDLELEEYIPQTVTVKLEFSADVVATWASPNPPSIDDNVVASSIADAVRKMLQDGGVNVVGAAYRMGRAQQVQGTVKFTNVDVEDYDVEEKNDSRFL